MTNIHVATLNVNGLNDDTKTYSIMNQLRALNCDIVALQETHITKDNIEKVQQAWTGKSIWNPSQTSSSGGTAILLGPKCRETSNKRDDTGRIITIKISKEENQLQLTNIYAPNDNQHKEHFYSTIDKYMYNVNHTILTGDFNMVENPNIDRNPTSTSSAHSKGLNNLNRIKEIHKLKDKWRDKHPHKRDFTWTRTAGEVASRLDRIYVSNNITHLNQKTIKTVFSDHSIVIAKILIQSKLPRGPGYYKVNTKILSDPEYAINMAHNIENLTLNEHNPNISWDMFKHKVKQCTIKYSKKYKRERRQLIEQLQNEINVEQDREVANSLTERIINLRNDIEGGVMIRTREATILNEDKPNKYFYLQEETRQKQGIIREIHTLDEHDEKITNIYKDEGDILRELHRHHADLYGRRESDPTERQRFIDMIDKQLTRKQRRDIDSDITLMELETAIKDMNQNKSPGPDGIPVEFYLQFIEEIGPKLLIVLNHIYTSNTQPLSHTIGYIKLIFKRGIKELLRNWRGITLLNVDHKILTKIISNRVRQVLPDIIDVDQTCGIPGRMIFDNHYLIRDIIDHAQVKKTPTWIISYDFKNAFDTVNHTYLIDTLRAFNFGNKFTNFIKMIYTQRKVYVMNNGHFSLPITMERGMTQGCSLAQYLFEVQSEPLAITIRKDTQIIGYKIPNQVKEAKLSMYADDTESATTQPKSVQLTINHFQRFENASGCALNKPKTKGITIATKKIPETETAIEWDPPDGMKVLGATYFEDAQMTENVNWIRAVEKVEQKIDLLNYRQLSLRGKVYILNTMVLSKVVFLSTVIPMPSWAWCDSKGNGIKQMVFKYLWGNANPEPIKREIIMLPKEKGGLGLLNLVHQGQALRLKFLLEITNKEIEKPWINIARYWLSTRLHHCKEEWAFLNDNYNNRLKYMPEGQDNTPQVYRKLIKDFRDHQTDITELKPRITPETAKDMYNIIRKKDVEKHSDIFASHAWNNNRIVTLNGPVKWKKVWLHTYKSFNVGPMRDTLYKILHNCLPTKVRIRKTENKKRPGRRFSTKCSVCNKADETTLHLFAQCKHAKNIWKAYEPIYTKLVPNKPNIYEHNILTKNVQHKMCPKKRKVILTMTEIILEEIWKTRNKMWKEGIEPSKTRSKNRINNNITDIITTHFKNDGINDFKTKFTMDQALCTVDNELKLQIHLPP